jgi:hypothetical protein
MQSVPRSLDVDLSSVPFAFRIRETAKRERKSEF